MIITGEKIQNECDLYIGRLEDFDLILLLETKTNKLLLINLKHMIC